MTAVSPNVAKSAARRASPIRPNTSSSAITATISRRSQSMGPKNLTPPGLTRPTAATHHVANKRRNMGNSQPLLFDLGSKKPTTRQIADLVKQGGTSALTEAEIRADHARYQEVVCRSALNRVLGMPFNWTLNPYRGCTHGCHYCFARRYHVQFEMNTDDEFASVILVKKNFVEVLTQELDRPSWMRELVAFGTATDPYQPIEGHYRLTRRSIEVLARARTPIGLITKGPMVVRDLDLLAELSRVTSCTVYMSVPTVDESAWELLEPGTAPPLQRLRAVRELVDG